MNVAPVLVGTATGLRSSSGVVAVLVGTPADRLPAPLRGAGAKVASVVVAAGELVADTLPSTPDRTGPLGLVPRVVLGALTGGQVARAVDSPPAAAALAGSAAAAGSAFAGLALRKQLAARLGSIPAALVEDALTAALAGSAVWLTRRGTEPRAPGA